MKNNKIRYAVVGLGWIAQDIILPAFAHAENSELTALVSGDPIKLRKLSKKYNVAFQYSYEEYDACLNSGNIDAVYIALPNSMHREYTVRAAKAGIHVLCEKPMALTEKDCIAMRESVQKNNVKLMIAYRLHFEEANLKAIDIAHSGRLGELRLFNSIYTQTVVKGNVRWNKKLSGGSFYDMGIYCLNALRYIFRDEPTEISAFATDGETINAILKFSKNRIASLTCSFSTTSESVYEVIGTKGVLRASPAFDYRAKLVHHLKIGDGKEQKKEFPLRDQFAPEIIYFSDCILKNKEPEPSGLEGQADVRVIEAIYKSARKNGKPVILGHFAKSARPSSKQMITRWGLPKPKLINANSAIKK